MDKKDQYPKLVRDKIPEIIKENAGVFPEQKTLSKDEEFVDYLLKKLVEEATEVYHSADQDNLEEELADVYEIIDTLLALRKTTRGEIDAIQKEKRAKRGGFEKRILMLKPVVE